MYKNDTNRSISSVIKNVNYLIILVWSFILYYLMLALFIPSSNLYIIFKQFQVVGFYPIFFDFLLFIYILFLIILYFKKGFLKRILALHFFPKNFSILIIINIIYLLLLGFYEPNFNPIAIFQIVQGNVPYFTWVVVLSLLIQIIAFRINQTKQEITLPSILLTLNFYFIVVASIFILTTGNQEVFNISDFFPLFLLLNIQTMTYDFAKVNMNPAEFKEFIKDHKVPMWVLIESKVFENEDDYKEAMIKGAKTGNQLYVTRAYRTDTYQMALKIRDANFPDIETYKRAQALGMKNYAELQRYEVKQQVIALKEKIQRKKRITFNEHHLQLNNLLKKTNKIKLDQLLEYLNIPNTKYLLVWLSNLPDDYPVKLENDSLALNEKITSKQLQMVIESLLMKLDSKHTITVNDVEKTRAFFAELPNNTKITMEQLELELDLSEDKIDYIVLFLLSKVPKFVNYNVEEEYFVRKDFNINVSVEDFPEFIEDMGNFV